MMKRKKSTFKNILNFSLLLILSFLIIISLKNEVYASDFSEDPIVFNVEYSGYSDYLNLSNTYKIVVPSSGKIKLTTYFENTNFAYKTGSIEIVNNNDNLVYSDDIIPFDVTKSNQKSITLYLAKGTYYITYSFGDANLSTDYFFTIDYDFKTSTNAKISSPKTGQLKITAPKGDIVNGFEVRYKINTSSNWTVKTVNGNTSLNQIFTKLKSGKKYQVQTRKFVFDNYGNVYYSKWTNIQTIKIK